MQAEQHHILFDIVVPVFNRPDEMRDLLESLDKQTLKNFRLIIIEDGSTNSSEFLVDSFQSSFSITYHYKANSGPGDSRNVGMSMARAEYVLLFDSDCIIPPHYFASLSKALSQEPLDAFGGPDTAHPDFSKVQKAINYAMTSLITTGGIRGKKNKLDTYQPRSFNMGIRREIIQQIGGFSDIHPGEDPDLSYRLILAGYKVGLVPEAWVYHKRRIDFKKFAKQVYKFGFTRVILMKWYPQFTKATYFLPALFLLGSMSLVALSLLIGPMALLPLACFIGLILADALRLGNGMSIALWAVLATFIQLYAYGYGFVKAMFYIKLLGHDERSSFPGFFFKK